MSLPRSTARRSLRAVLTASGTAVAAVALLTAASPATASPTRHSAPKPTVVLVHGAWADGSSWDGVTRRLLDDGYPVRAFPTPLQSLSGDSAALRTFLGAVKGPVVLVGHSYGGAVVTEGASGNAQVKALVYVDAFAPAAGEPVLALPGAASALNDPGVLEAVPPGAPPAATELYVAQSSFAADFANDLPSRRAAVLAATQRPVTLGALLEPATVPAWAGIPSWYEVGTLDKVIPPQAQRAMAARAGSHVTEAPTGHLPMVSLPGAVVALVESAANATS